MTSPAQADWHHDRGFNAFARSLSTRYAGIAINALLGLAMLPFNLQHLGKAAYGLWMLTASVTTYFSAFDLGYGGATVRLIAEYRARKDTRALNEILSTMFYVYSAIGVACYAAAVLVSFLLGSIFRLDAEQARVGQMILLIIAANVALKFPFSVYGGVVNAFQSHYLNNVLGTATTILAAVANVAVLSLGYGLVELVATTTFIRVAPFWLFRRNAFKVFPALDIRREHFRRERLREVTGISAYFAVSDWAARLNFTLDTVVIGIFLNTTSVAMYAVAQRLAQSLLRITTQLQVFLLPSVILRNVKGAVEEQQRLVLRATRFQLGTAIAICGGTAAVAPELLRAWVGPGYEESALVLQLLAYVVTLRAFTAMSDTLLKGTGHHRFIAIASSVCGVANLLLSIALVKVMGNVGVALGTVIPVTILETCVIFPTACRQLRIPVWTAYRRVVWPAAWPALCAVLFIVSTKAYVPQRLIGVLAHLGTGVLIYAAVFLLFALGREERQWYFSKITGLAQRRPAASPAAA